MAFTGIFPRPGEPVPTGLLTLVLCHECGLLQLAHNFDLKLLYGPTYGYRSGLNASMVAHLKTKANQLSHRVYPVKSDVILDIGSNDGTLLANYPVECQRLGVDPNADKWRHYYPTGIEAINDFFPSHEVEAWLNGRKPKIITTVAMFYDLPDPLDFTEKIARMLHEDGIWHLEQLYLPAMLATNGFDSICHEHLEYYSLSNINHLCNLTGLKIIDVTFNTINGGSFAVTVAHKDSYHNVSPVVTTKLREERSLGLTDTGTYRRFKVGIDRMMAQLDEVLDSFKGMVLGYGASTKGNVLLQYNSISLPAIAEVNPDKFGCVTPGTNIPIISESEAKAMKPEAFLVLPWHFYESIVKRESEYLRGGGQLILPLPNPKVICE